jgi:uncharacterized protein
MRVIFADTCYWIALANPKDQLSTVVKNVSKELGEVHIYTTDSVIEEFLNYFCKLGQHMRVLAVGLVSKIYDDPNTTVFPQTRATLKKAIELYAQRSDKKYSLTDCISMETMTQHKLTEVLTDDHHFSQEQFMVLIPKSTK